MSMTYCISISNLSDYLPHTFDGILTQYYAQFVNKVLCFPDYVLKVAYWYKSGKLSDTEFYYVVNYLIENGHIYIA